MTRRMDDALGALYEETYETLYAVAYRRVGESALAEDLVQETFLRLLLRLEELAGHANLKGWLMKTLCFLISNELRLTERRNLPLEAAFAKAAENAGNSVSELLPEGLGEDERRILTWRFEQRPDFRRISDRLGVTESGCRSRLSRALGRCRELLGGRENFFDLF